MAARKRLTHNQKTRDKIQTSMLIQRLEKFVKSDPETPDGDGGKVVNMTGPQVTAALGLLKKTIPDLQSIDGSLDLNHGLTPELAAWLNQS